MLASVFLRRQMAHVVRAAMCAAQEILDVEQVMEENKGLELTPANIETVRLVSSCCLLGVMRTHFTQL